MNSIRQQLRGNAVALISLLVAVSALGYNTWRNETTEEQRNVRHAAFRILESLGELQEIVDARFYYLPWEDDPGREGDSRIRGFGTVGMVRDLSGLMPPPAGQAGSDLHTVWAEHFLELHRLDAEGRRTDDAARAERELRQAIDKARAAILQVLAELD